MVEVNVAEVGPHAAVEEACDVVKPVGIAGYPRGILVRRGPPVVSPAWCAATDGVSGQNQRAEAVVAALLP